MAGALAIVSAINAWLPDDGGRGPPAWRLLFLACALVCPAVLKPLNWAWFRFGLLLHAVVNPIVMGLLFFVAVTPTGWIMRLRGKDLLRLKREPQSDTLLDHAGAAWACAGNAQGSVLEMKSFLQNSLLFLVASAIGLGGVELGLRVWGTEVIGMGSAFVFFRFDPVLGWDRSAERARPVQPRRVQLPRQSQFERNV